METPLIFFPPRRTGLLVHLLAALLLGASGVWCLLQASRAEVGPEFVLYLLPALLCLGLTPVAAYRGYSLWKASYELGPDGLRILWGLRLEEIPMDQVLWVRKPHESGLPLKLPVIRWPGAYVGVSRVSSLTIEYLAAGQEHLLFVATPGRIFAISPEDRAGFLDAYQRFSEMGSFDPFPARSIFPRLLLFRMWENKIARTLVLLGLTFSLILLVWVALLIPKLPPIPLGAYVGSNSDLVPPLQLLLLPVLNSAFFLADFLYGLYFFRRPANQPLAYLLWFCGVISPIFFIVAVFFIVLAV